MSIFRGIILVLFVIAMGTFLIIVLFDVEPENHPILKLGAILFFLFAIGGAITSGNADTFVAGAVGSHMLSKEKDRRENERREREQAQREERDRHREFMEKINNIEKRIK